MIPLAFKLFCNQGIFLKAWLVTPRKNNNQRGRYPFNVYYGVRKSNCHGLTKEKTQKKRMKVSLPKGELRKLNVGSLRPQFIGLPVKAG